MRPILFIFLLTVIAVLVGCSPGDIQPVSEPLSLDLPTRFPKADRIVAIGDLHGDLAATRRALRVAGAIDEQDQWTGEDLVIVQTGDILDRGGDELIRDPIPVRRLGNPSSWR